MRGLYCHIDTSRVSVVTLHLDFKFVRLALRAPHSLPQPQRVHILQSRPIHRLRHPVLINPPPNHRVTDHRRPAGHIAIRCRRQVLKLAQCGERLAHAVVDAARGHGWEQITARSCTSRKKQRPLRAMHCHEAGTLGQRRGRGAALVKQALPPLQPISNQRRIVRMDGQRPADIGGGFHDVQHACRFKRLTEQVLLR